MFLRRPCILSDVSTFKQLYLIGKILGESLSLKLITSKCLFRWELSDEATIIDMGDDFTLVKFSNVMNCNKVLQDQPWFWGGQIYCLQIWKKKISPIKEKLQTVLLWIHLPYLPLEMWKDRALRHILSPICRLIKIDHDSEEVSKGLFSSF